MPTKTFYNLPEEKRIRIFEAAVDEFSEVRFSEASINRIVKAAGISRGSFYQYFEDKDDLFRHVVAKIGQEKIGIYEQNITVPPDVDLFENIMGAIPAMFEWADRNEKYNRIGLLLATEQPDMVNKIFANENAVWFVDYLRERQRRGLIRMGVDPLFIMELLQSITLSLLREYYLTDNRESAMRKVRQFFDVVANGISVGCVPAPCGNAVGEESV